MPQPRKQTRRTGAGARSTRSTASGSRSQGARARSTRASSQAKSAAAKSAAAKPAEAADEGAGERIRDLNERIIDAGKRAGRGTLDIYESTLKAIADTIERGPGSSDIEWVSKVATTQANFLRDVSKAWTSMARDALR